MSFWTFEAHLKQLKAEADWRILLAVLRLTEVKGIH